MVKFKSRQNSENGCYYSHQNIFTFRRSTETLEYAEVWLYLMLCVGVKLGLTVMEKHWEKIRREISLSEKGKQDLEEYCVMASFIICMFYLTVYRNTLIIMVLIMAILDLSQNSNYRAPNSNYRGREM
jgi:hypothetical protein